MYAQHETLDDLIQAVNRRPWITARQLRAWAGRAILAGVVAELAVFALLGVSP